MLFISLSAGDNILPFDNSNGGVKGGSEMRSKKAGNVVKQILEWLSSYKVMFLGESNSRNKGF